MHALAGRPPHVATTLRVSPVGLPVVEVAATSRRQRRRRRARQGERSRGVGCGPARRAAGAPRQYPLGVAQAHGGLRLGAQGLILGSSGGGHRSGEFPFLGKGRRPGEPHAGGAVGFTHGFGDPLELLAGPGVGRQRDKPVAELGDTEAAQLAPDRLRGVDGSRGIR